MYFWVATKPEPVQVATKFGLMQLEPVDGNTVLMDTGRNVVTVNGQRAVAAIKLRRFGEAFEPATDEKGHCVASVLTMGLRPDDVGELVKECARAAEAWADSHQGQNGLRQAEWYAADAPLADAVKEAADLLEQGAPEEQVMAKIAKVAEQYF